MLLTLIFSKSKKRFQKKGSEAKKFRYFEEKNNDSQFKSELSQGNFFFVRKFEIKLPES